MAADGKSFITSIGIQRSTLWLRKNGTEKQITFEGNANFFDFGPFSRDGRYFYFLMSPTANVGTASSHLWRADIEKGRTEQVVADHDVNQYALVSNDKEIAFTSGDSLSELWLASTEGRFAPRKLADGVRRIRSGPGGIWYSVEQDGRRVIYRLPMDGSSPQKILEGFFLEAVAQDGTRLLVGRDSGDPDQKETQIEGVSLAAPSTLFPICANCWARWSGDGRYVYISFGQNNVAYARQEHGSTIAIPVDLTTGFPRIPRELHAEAELMKLPGARVVAPLGTAISTDGSVIAFTRTIANRNLFKIPLQ